MKWLEVGTTLGVGVLLFLGLPLLVSFGIYRFVKHKKYAPGWRLLALLPIVPLALAFYGMQELPDQPYRLAFTEVTQLPFPPTGGIRSESRFQHGGYQHGDDLVFFLSVDASAGQRIEDAVKTRGFAQKPVADASREWAAMVRAAWTNNGRPALGAEYLWPVSADPERPLSIKYYVGISADHTAAVFYRRGD